MHEKNVQVKNEEKYVQVKHVQEKSKDTFDCRAEHSDSHACKWCELQLLEDCCKQMRRAAEVRGLSAAFADLPLEGLAESHIIFNRDAKKTTSIDQRITGFAKEGFFLRVSSVPTALSPETGLA